MTRARNIKLVIEYDGGAYSGWQYQPRRQTVQGTLMTAIEKLTTQQVTLYGAGRTDAGVHASGQVANFRITHDLPIAKFRVGLNFYLPDDILVASAEEVPYDFHARYGAVYRRYQYLIGRERSVRFHRRRWELNCALKMRMLQETADEIIGDHDFSAFCVTASQKANNHCLVYESRWREAGSMWRYDITADRFVHTMIRSLVGVMVEVARGGMTRRQFREMFHSGDHSTVRKVAPAHGLCLVAVGY